MYNKLFASILDSSIWLEDNPTRIVWFTFLAAMDEDGFARFASVRNLANRARVSNEEAAAAVLVLEDKDLDSSDPENDGRRIQRVPGGWMILNAGKYRELATRLISREKTRQRVAHFREKLSCNGYVTVGNEEKQNVTHASASASASAFEHPSDEIDQGDARGGAEDVEPGDPEDRSEPEIDHSEPREPEAKPRRARRVRKQEPAIELTVDWVPSDGCLSALCVKYQCEPPVVLAHLPEFRLYWIEEGGAGTTKKPCDWNSTFRNKIDKVAGWGGLIVRGQQKAKTKYGPPQPTDTRDDSWLNRTVRDQRTQE